MTTLDMIAATMKEQLTAVQLGEFRPIFCQLDIARKAHDCLYNWIVDIEPAPSSIIELLNNLNRLEGFSGRHGFQDLVTITCLEGIARRRPEVLEGSLEELILLIVLFSDYIAFHGIQYEKEDIVSLSYIKEWISEYCSLNLCPNPCLRLELFRFMSDFGIEGDVAFQETLIFTLCELQDKFSTFEIKDIRKFSALNLKNLMESYSLNMGNILKLDYPKHKKKRIIHAVVKITKMLVVLEEQNMRSCWSQNMVLSLDFCGLIKDVSYDNDLNSFADVVSNNSLLQEYVADTLRLITATYSKINGHHLYEASQATRKISKILSSMVAAEARLLPLRLNCLPMHLCDLELNGITPPIVHQMLYFTTIKKRDYIEENNEDTFNSDSSEYTNNSEFDYFSGSSYSSDDE